MTIAAEKLNDTLASALPKDSDCIIRYINTPSRPCGPLFSPPLGHEVEKTRLASHLLTVSTTASRGSQGANDSDSDVLVLGIEVLVYTTQHLTTIFVSKADSTGFHRSQNSFPVRTIATAFLDWLAGQQRQKHPGRQIVISLFARAQAQYLFPGSAENGKKHVLDDRQLIKWWAKVLDPILGRVSDRDIGQSAGAWVTVPGFEGGELRQFFPPSSRTAQLWRSGNPLGDIAETRGLSKDVPPRALLPRFPDDPKARFMQDLDDEVGISGDSTTVSPTKRAHGNWKNIRNLNRFWEAMEFRQECSSGRMVGFLWLVITPEESARSNGENVSSQDSSLSTRSNPSSSDSIAPVSGFTPVANGSPRKRKRKHLTGPIVSREPRLKGGSSGLSATASNLDGMLNSVRDDGLLLTNEGYGQAMQTLLHLDFGTAEVAVRSTRKWMEEVRSICGLSGDWAVVVEGTAPSSASAQDRGAGSLGGQVNDLGGMVRKKRKVIDQAGGEDCLAAETGVQVTGGEKPAVNMLGAGMVRKKPKPPPDAT